jgi:hypothetical protein
MKSILIVGTARNVSNKIVSQIVWIREIMATDFDIEFFVVESDSSDDTVVKLDYLSQKYTNFKYETLGPIAEKIPSRIQRLRFCRNRYVEFIRHEAQDRWDYVIVMDLDGINRKITRLGLISCFNQNEEWDACFPVQKYGYYDLLALRANNWSMSDPIHEMRVLVENERAKTVYSSAIGKILLYIKIDRIRKKYFYSKMLKFSGQTKLIPVLSAFGGIGIYRSIIFHEADYGHLESTEGCEHVDLNLRATQLGYKLVINTSFINSHWNSYNLNRMLLVRLYRMTGFSFRRH